MKKPAEFGRTGLARLAMAPAAMPNLLPPFPKPISTEAPAAATAPGDFGGTLPATAGWVSPAPHTTPLKKGRAPGDPAFAVPSQRKSNFWVQSVESPALSLSPGLDPAGITLSPCHRDAAGSFHLPESPGSHSRGAAHPRPLVGLSRGRSCFPQAGWGLEAGEGQAGPGGHHLGTSLHSGMGTLSTWGWPSLEQGQALMDVT